MAKNLKTEFKRIGRSGPTVDGRVIEPQMLEQAAKNYNKDTFTALIWPEHERWYNMGTVEELRTAKNSEGGVDLYAIIAPNEYYQSINASGQKLFTSMELLPNFRDTGEYYLTGLAATDTPASAGTQEMRFSALNNKAALVSVFTEQIPLSNPDDQPPSWFTRLFNPTHEDVMSKQALAALAEKFTELEQKLDAALKTTDKQGATDAPEGDKKLDSYSALSEKVEALAANVTAMMAKLEAATVGSGEDKPNDQFAQLAAALKKLREDFNQALEGHGTDPGEQLGDGEKIEDYI